MVMDETSNNSISPFRKKKKRTGPESKCTPTVIKKIVKSIRAGNFPDIAAVAAGISKSAYINWIKWGNERPGSEYEYFTKQVEEAEAYAEAKGIEMLTKLGNQSWQALAWRLERRFADRWSKVEKQEITTNQAPLVQITLPSNGREVIESKVTEQITNDVSDAQIPLIGKS